VTWSTAIFDTQTGAPMSPVQPASGTWGRGDVTSRSHAVPLRGDGFTQAQRRDLYRAWDRTLVQMWDGKPVYGGLILGTDYDMASGILTVNHCDVRVLLSRRWMYGIGGYSPTGSVVIDNLSLRGIAARLGYIGLQAPISGAWPIPVVIPAEEAGSIDRTYYHYEFQTVAEALSEIESMDGGPDTDLQPRLDAEGRLYWEYRIGNPLLDGPDWEFNIAAEKQPLLDLHVKEDAAKQTTGVFAVGKGAEADMRVGGAAASVSAGLAKDTLITLKDIDDVAQLNSHAQAELNALYSPTTQWSFNVLASELDTGTQNLGDLTIGSTVRTLSSGDEWIADGVKDHYTVGYTGDYGYSVTFQVQEA